MKIALLGAESTGKSTLGVQLVEHFRAQGCAAELVPEVLREWCAREGRTPRMDEQFAIAQEQQARVDAAAARAQFVIADTTSLMIAIYSAMLFADRSLLPQAIAWQRGYDHTLVTGLDIPWIADGHQRDGPHVREPVDALVRGQLQEHGIAYRVVYGSGPERLASALDAIGMGAPRADDAQTGARWAWSCEKCSDPECEHKLFTGMLGKHAPE